ncbi:hypothetical protein TRICHSKD4_4128 [Roseibium sp. TrichSKD4]|nr:hypothetical protein TRICHSKD4_4128 [Roseibium sp. TrichSKD4]
MERILGFLDFLARVRPYAPPNAKLSRLSVSVEKPTLSKL